MINVEIGFDLDCWVNYGRKFPITVPYDKMIHWQILGNSGSGKSYYTLYLLRNLLVAAGKKVKIWFLDFKNSEDFAFMKGYERYFAGSDCGAGLTDFYNEFQRVKSGEICDGVLRLCFFDEVAGFQIWESAQDKKQAERYKAMLLEVLLLGRSMLCGVTVIMQRNDAAYISGRDQAFVTVCFGKMGRDFKAMVMQGEELEQKDIYLPGEGIIKIDSMGTRFFKAPKLRNIDKVKGQIVAALGGCAIPL